MIINNSTRGRRCAQIPVCRWGCNVFDVEELDVQTDRVELSSMDEPSRYAFCHVIV